MTRLAHWNTIRSCESLVKLAEQEIGHTMHLTQKQCGNLASLQTEFSGVFSKQPGQCRVGVHKIRIIEEAKPMRVYLYKIPMKLRAEVERQIDQLLDWDLIYPVLVTRWCAS